MKRLSLIPAVSTIGYTGGMLIGKTDIKKVRDDSFAPEAYEINIKKEIVVKASTERGFFYAQKTLKQIFAQYGDSIPCMIIEDEPKYEYRSFMIDCCRHYFPVPAIKKMIDLCSDFKFNKFHWHLSEDQGWRIQIDKYPELTKIGSVRHGTSLGTEVTWRDYGGYYTKDDVREVLEYAKERFIDVIPEIDLPGHTSALLAAIPELSCFDEKVEVKKTQGVFRDVLCIGNEKTFEVVYNILDEMCEMFPYEYFHIGGDECPRNHWKKCPKCQALIKSENLSGEDELQQWFTNKVMSYLKAKGKKVIGWNECLKGGKLDSDAVIQYWMGDKKNVTESGHKMIVSDFFAHYADYPYGMTPLKKTYNFNVDLCDNVIGVESPIWTEYVPSLERMLYMCFPRYIAVAENAWCKEKPDYKAFESNLLKVMKSYDTSCWAPKKDWNPGQIKGKIGTARFFAEKLNDDMKAKIKEDAKIAKEK